LLEPELAARALPHVDAALIARLRAIDAEVNAAIARGDAGGYVRANATFHATLYAASEAPALLALVESVSLQLNPSMRVITGRAGTGGLVDQHAAALRALDARDEATLRAAIRDDALQAQALIAQLAPA
jgi:DNA-binding GntR family transcriptional regulator